MAASEVNVSESSSYEVDSVGKLLIDSLYCGNMYGHLERNNRRVVPSCVVLSIRRKYPAPDGQYLGFREYREHELAFNHTDFRFKYRYHQEYIIYIGRRVSNW